MIDGVFRHQDSNGGGGLITDGDTQWMTAGAGLSFSSHHPPDQHCLVRPFSHYLAQYPRNPTEDSNAPEVPSRRWSRAAETVAPAFAKDDHAGPLPEICQKLRYA
jgi:redox-sensitive bicupin YhaK (pirin superfamily)